MIYRSALGPPVAVALYAPPFARAGPIWICWARLGAPRATLSLSGKTSAYAWHRAHTPRRDLAGLSQRGGKFAGLFTLQSDEGLLEILKQGLTRVSHHR